MVDTPRDGEIVVRFSDASEAIHNVPLGTPLFNVFSEMRLVAFGDGRRGKRDAELFSAAVRKHLGMQYAPGSEWAERWTPEGSANNFVPFYLNARGKVSGLVASRVSWYRMVSNVALRLTEKETDIAYAYLFRLRMHPCVAERPYFGEWDLHTPKLAEWAKRMGMDILPPLLSET